MQVLVKHEPKDVKPAYKNDEKSIFVCRGKSPTRIAQTKSASPQGRRLQNKSVLNHDSASSSQLLSSSLKPLEDLILTMILMIRPEQRIRAMRHQPKMMLDASE